MQPNRLQLQCSVLTCICARFTSMYCQLSVENAIASSATATTAVMVARDKVTAEHGMVKGIN